MVVDQKAETGKDPMSLTKMDAILVLIQKTTTLRDCFT